MKIKQALFLLPGLFAVSCEKAFIPPDPIDSQENNFEFLWKVLDEKYASFKYKNVDWDSVYRVYKPQVNNNMHDTTLFHLLTNVIVELKDGHITLAAPFRKVFWGWFLQAPPNFNERVLFDHYLKNEYQVAGPMKYKIFDSTGYIYYGSLSGTLKQEHLDEVMGHMETTKGIIIDIRDNAGGEVLNAEKFAARFNPQTRLVSYWLFKNGPGRNDFTAPVPFYLSSAEKNAYTKPVALLVNRTCYSAANDLTLMFKALPHVTIIGDTTGGGGGIPMHTELPNGWVLGFPTTQTLSPGKENVENGIVPHVLVYMTEEDEKKGRDSILETALHILK